MAEKRIKGADAAKNPLADNGPDERVPEPVKAQVKQILKQIERAKTLTKDFRETTLPQLRRQMAGTYKADSDATNVRTNLIFATAATLLPHIYAKNPEISVSPSETVDDSEYDTIRSLCKACQIAVNKLLVEEAKLKTRVKSGIRSTMTTSVGWFKLSYQSSITNGDPLIIRRQADAQENLQRIEWLIKSADATTDVNKLNQKKQELIEQQQGVTSNAEMKIFKGFALDRVKTEDMFILDESITEFDEYVDAKKMAHRVWMTDEDYEQAFGKKIPSTATKYGQPAAQEMTDEQGIKIAAGEEQGTAYRAVYEVWDKTTNLVSTVCEGCEDYCRYPAPMKASPERWYPFYALGFNVIEGRWRPLSDVELLQKLQDEYNTTRFLYAEARKEAIPIRIFRKAGGLTPEDITALTTRKARDWLGVEGNPTQKIDADIMQLEGVKIDPTAYDVTIIRNDMDMMVGLSDASRSNLIQAKTATEAEIMKQALMTRVAERQDTVEDVVGEMALSTLQMAMEVFSKAEIEQLCGKGAGEAWPEEASREEIFRKLRVQVKAGSSGKPNLMKERESWAQVMPIMQETMTKVAELRAQGQFDLAQSLVELLKETLQRYDEKIDVERFIPKQQVGPDGQPVNDPRMQAMQQVEQMKLQSEEMAKELQQCKQQLQDCEMELKAAKYAEQARIAEAEATKAVDVARETSKHAIQSQESQQKHVASLTDVNAERAREEVRMASEERIKKADIESREYAALIAAAGKLVEAMMAPKPAPAGGEGDGQPAAAAQPAPADVAKMMTEAVASIHAMAQSMVKAKSTPMRVVLDANGLPAGLEPATQTIN